MNAGVSRRSPSAKADGITCALIMSMGDLDRRKHDVDILERVIGGIRDSGESDRHSRVVDVDVPGAGGSPHSTLEVTVGIDGNESSTGRTEGPRRRS